MQKAAAQALRDGLENWDRKMGVWRGTGKTIPADKLGPDQWRQALANVDIPRDIYGWYPAVVLSTDGGDATVGIEGVADTEDAPHVIPAKDVTWARKKRSNGHLGPRAKTVGDLVSVGDVVYVRKVTSDKDGSFIRWSLRQIPKIEGAFMAMDVNTGRVIAMQGGFSYQHSTFNRATQAMRQPGSNFKPFVYAAALDSGFTPATIVVDAPIEVNTPQGIWRPKNAGNKYYGPVPMRIGLEQSRNLMTIRLAQEVGMDTVAAYAQKFGVYDHLNRTLSSALGADETTLFKIVSAYAMFANGGERVEPTLVDRVQDRWGAHDLSPRPAHLRGLQRPDAAAGAGAGHRQPPRAGDRRHHRLPADLDDAGRHQPRHGGRGGQPAGAGGGQDRHHQPGQGCLVHRLHLEHRGRLLHRL